MDIGSHAIWQRQDLGETVKDDIYAAAGGFAIGGSVEEVLGGFKSFKGVAQKVADNASKDASKAVSGFSASQAERPLSSGTRTPKDRAPVPKVTISSASKALIAKGIKDFRSGEGVVGHLKEAGERFIAGSTSSIAEQEAQDPGAQLNWFTVAKDGARDAATQPVFG